MTTSVTSILIAVYMLLSWLGFMYIIQKDTGYSLSFKDKIDEIKNSTIQERVYIAIITLSVVFIIRGSVLIFYGIKHNIRNHNARIEEAKKTI